MKTSPSDPMRILGFAPTPADAEITETLLAESGFEVHVFRDLRELARAAEEAAGALLLTEIVLENRAVRELAATLARQPAWSDLPVVLLCERGADSPLAGRALDLLGNVSVLERPVRVASLLAALRTSLRARARQYLLRNQLLALEHAEAASRNQGERLRLLWESASVLLRTEDPKTMMRALFARIAPHLGLDAYFDYLATERGDGLVLQSWSGLTDEEAASVARIELGQGICGTVAQQRQPIAVNRIQESSDPMVAAAKRFGIKALVCNPLVTDDRLLGTLSFGTRRRDSLDSEELGFLRTITRYVTVANERLRLIRELKETDRRKDEFLATLAHELRNPLAPIRNALHITRLASGEESVVEKAREMMERQLGQMVRLIDDLLDVSRVTRGKLELKRERVPLTDVLASAVETVRPLIETFGHEISIDLPAEPILLDADPVRLAQVFSNLLTNAAKYMDRDGHIWLSAERLGADVVVRVRDAGMGIPREALPSVFDMFTQVDRSLERAQGGLGIGLTLVKRLVEMHGGSVEARSEGIGHGAEFVARLPMAAPSGAEEPLAARSAVIPATARYRILVADDNRDAAESMSLLLRLMGNDVRTVHDGVLAVAEADTFRPDVVLLDIGMPRMNGYDAARSIRREPWGSTMVLVALTGWGQEEDKRKAIEAGFDCHFTKPISPPDLERFVEGLAPSTPPVRPNPTPPAA